MKTYKLYKDSGIEWLGKIPEHWGINKFRRVSYMKGRIGWQGLKQAEFSTDPNLPYLITGMNFKDGIIRWEEVYHITEERYEEAPEIQLKELDILMTKDGTIGKLLYVDFLPNKASLNSHLLVFRPLNGSYYPRYMYYQLHCEPFKYHVELFKTGTTFYGITQEATGQYKVILPPIDEQTAIASFLDHKTRQIDDLIAKKERLIELLKEERTSVINQAVTKGLPAEARAKAGLDSNVPMKDSGIEWLGEIPENWEVKRLKYSIQIKSGEGISNPDLIAEGKYPVYGGNGILGYSDLLNSEEIEIIIGRVGALCGNVYLVDGNKWISDNALRVKTKDNFEFTAHLLRSMNLNDLASKTAQPLLTSTLIRNQVAAFPDLNEQHDIAEFIKEQELSFDSKINKIIKQVLLIKEYKTSLINSAVTGKIDVR